MGLGCLLERLVLVMVAPMPKGTLNNHDGDDDDDDDDDDDEVYD